MIKNNSNPTLGLKENLSQFIFLIIVNAFVGAMIGLERSILPAIAEQEFHLIIKSAIFSFIIVFGFTKAFTNYFAGRLSEKYGRKPILITGWLFAIPVPFILMFAPSWNWILFANLFLGISQGLTWSTTVIMKIDLVGSSRRGLAMGLNEFAGYFAVAGSALATGYIASNYGLRPEPFYLGIAYVVIGLFMSIFVIKETLGHAIFEAKNHPKSEKNSFSQKEIFIETSFRNKELSSVTQAGFVNNLNDGMAWGLFPLFFASFGLDIKSIGILAAIYPMSWGLFQLYTGNLSDKIGRKGLIVWGMWLQALGIIVTVYSNAFLGFAIGALMLGIGTAMVYPTFLAAISDVAHPSWRASSVGIYRFWRDSGYAIGAIISGITSDLFGINVAILLIAFITFLSGVIVSIRMKETLKKQLSNSSFEIPSCISLAELEKIMQSKKDLMLIDVRTPQEFIEGHIEGSFNIPVDELEHRRMEIKKNIMIITICGKGGGRSDNAALILKQNGWSESKPLCGGFNAFKAKGK